MILSVEALETPQLFVVRGRDDEWIHKFTGHSWIFDDFVDSQAKAMPAVRSLDNVRDTFSGP